MPFRIESTSLRLLSRQIFVIILGVSLLFTALGAVSYLKIRQSTEAWQAYHASHDRGHVLIARLIAAIGYGGMIHNFKNYVLRGGEKRFSLVQQRGGAALTVLDEMRILLDDPEGRNAIDAVAAMVRSYLEEIQVVREMRRNGHTPEEIDRVVKVDDMPALLALNRLELRMRASDAAPQFDLLFKFSRVAGYGGIVHHIKNYILRRDAPRAKLIEKAIGEARDVLRAYSTQDLTDKEIVALATLEELVDTFERITVQIGSLAAEGADAVAIDARVRWNDGLAMAALLRTQEQQALRDAATLKRALAEGRGLALGLALAIALILPLTAWGIVQQLKQRAVTPMQRISEAMTKLARGEVGPDVSALAGDSEIGKIAAASQAFRVAHLSRARELARERQDDVAGRITRAMPW